MTVNTPATYGLLQGNVYSLGYCDAEMIPLEGAVVTISGATGDVWTLETDQTGFYQLYLDESNTPVTIDVTYDGNEAGHVEGVVIVGGMPTTQDFSLRWLQPCLSVDPLSLAVTQLLGETTTLQLTLTNDGASPATWQFQEADGGYEPNGIHIPAFTGTLPRNGAASTAHAPNVGAQSSTEQISPDFARILGSQAYAIDVYPGYNLVTFDTDTPGTWTVIANLPGSQYFGGDFIAGDDTNIYAVEYGMNQLHKIDKNTGAVTVVGSAVPGGGESWTGLTGAPDGTLYGSATTCSSSTLYTVNPDTGETTPVGQITNGACIIDIAATSDGRMFGVDIVNSNLVSIDPATGAGTIVGSLGVSANYAQGLDFDPQSGLLFWAAYTSSGELRVIDMETGASLLIGGFPGGAEVDSLAFPISGGDIPWLSEAPESGTLPPDGGTQVADVTFDAGIVTLPGTYLGTLSVKSDDPYNGRISVPVTMTVTAPASYGTLEGTVTGLGYCDADPSALQKAVVVITSALGDVWTLETDENGHYFTWLDSTANPYTIEVSYPEYMSGSTTADIVPVGNVVVDLTYAGWNLVSLRRLKCLKSSWVWVMFKPYSST
jgi:hypothetical protein